MEHFQFTVGNAIVHVHQAFNPWDTAFVRIECGGEEKTITVKQEDRFQKIELEEQTP